MRLSLRWAERSRAAFGTQPGRAVFGIVQGGAEKALRIESARELAAMDFHGYSIGGLAVGEPQAVMLDMIETVEPHLPQAKPRYLMGVGTPDDLLKSLRARRRHVRLRDADASRAARHGLHSPRANESAQRALGRRSAADRRGCPRRRPARDYSRAYWRHLVKAGEILAMMALTAVNLAYYQDLMAGARAAIGAGPARRLHRRGQGGLGRLAKQRRQRRKSKIRRHK